MMVQSEMLRVRVDRATAKRVEAWARAHGTDVSGTLRKALEKLLDEEERSRRVEAALKELREAEAIGLFDPPRPGECWKAGGFR